MLLLWILYLIGALLLLRYAYLILKRALLTRRINKRVESRGGNATYCRNRFASIFIHDGKPDILVLFNGKTIEISVITAPIRRARYHFDINNKLLELIIERRAVYVTSRSGKAGVMDRVYTIRKYKMEIEPSKNGNQRYVILNPAPIALSKAERSVLTGLYDNDELVCGVRVCGLKWFMENVL